MTKNSEYTDDYTGAPIDDEANAVEVTIKRLKSGEETVSHLHADTVDNLIQSDPDLEGVFIHD